MSTTPTTQPKAESHVFKCQMCGKLYAVMCTPVAACPEYHSGGPYNPPEFQPSCGDCQSTNCAEV